LCEADAAKVSHVGYSDRRLGGPSRDKIRATLDMQTDRLVLVTVGGGLLGGERVLECMLVALRAMQGPPSFDCLLVSGPLVPRRVRQRLSALLPNAATHFIDAVPDLTAYLAAADAVVSRAGYSTVCEILSLKRPALLVPLVEFDQGNTPYGGEQTLRAKAFEKLGLARMLPPDEMTPARLLTEVRGLLDQPFTVPDVLNFQGLPNFVAEAAALLDGNPWSDD
jgi:predicted glycosyltransferase